jgi:hypothetical protein
MIRHGLSDWAFRFDHARRRFGSCQRQRKLITLSRPLTFLNNEDQVRDTLLHEIAHALTPGEGHSDRWRAKCVEIGAKPKRCYGDDEVVSPPRRDASYLIGCVKCDWWHDRRRITGRKLACSKCRAPVEYRVKSTGQKVTIIYRDRR